LMRRSCGPSRTARSNKRRHADPCA
jgi:hypothetical protein